MDLVRGLKIGPTGKPIYGPFVSFVSVENVTLCRRGDSFAGTLYLAEHHLVFTWILPGQPDTTPPRQLWITYPMIHSCTYRLMPPISRQDPAIRLRCRDFAFVAFQFHDEANARIVYDNIKILTCQLGSLDKLYAFSYKPPSIETRCNGWQVYDARREYKRMGIGPKEADRGWRLSDINHDFAYSPTYPGVLVVPTSVSDNVLKHGGSYRSKARIPALTYLHPVNNCSITRSSQPLVGLFKGKRNPQDERLVAAIFSTSKPAITTSVLPPAASTEPEESQERLVVQSASATDLAAFQAQEKAVNGSMPTTKLSHVRNDSDIAAAKVYGAQQRNLIIDARPVVNARVNQIGGMGSENMEYYKDATINFLGIDNIHHVRDSLGKVVEALQHADYTRLPPDQELLAKSKWLKFIKLILRGSDLVARQIGVNHSHVLIHCSDGWDRTSQISAISQLCLDPYYRTLEGFIVLVEKDWLSFGHMFRRRNGPLGSEKWFDVENERVGPNKKQENGAGQAPGAANAFEHALWSAKGFFNKKNDSRESLVPEGEGEASPSQARTTTPSKHDKYATRPGETSPIFHQFLDATWQLLRQHPNRFEINERFLRRLLYQVYSCQYGTFLYDNERERVEAKAYDRTRSVWDYFLARKEQFVNKDYDPTIDDKVAGRERLIFPDSSKVRWWPEIFARTDEEMNGTPSAPAASLPREEEPVVTGIESADVVAGPAANASILQSLNAGSSLLNGGADRLSTSLSSLGLGRQNASDPRPRSPPREETSEPETRAIHPPARMNEMSFQAFARDSAFRDN